MTQVRPEAVAGQFYPAQAETLREQVEALLAQAPAGRTLPKALIVPHAGYVYSGPVAARAYALLKEARGIRRVLLLGSAHRAHYKGVALPEVEAYRTPLGEVPLDRDTLAALAGREDVLFSDAPHEQEHSLEVQLPFLQVLLDDFVLLPALAGEIPVQALASFLNENWGGPETLILVSSDLSHFLAYEKAQEMDAKTSRLIENLDSRGWNSRQACGAQPIRALLDLARQRSLRVEPLDLRNSGDTAGGRDQVVGYGAWAFFEEGS